jgi:transcriptional antiterminator Rof (Rho-off)
MDQDFRSVNCAFYEDLELLAMKHSSVEISFEAANGTRAVVRDQITDLFTRDRVEYLRTKAGLEIELVKILEINGKRPTDAC